MKRPRLFGGPDDESYRLYALAGALLLGGPVWQYLYAERYPASADYALLVGGAALGGAVAALVARRLGGLVGTLGFGALVYVFQDLQFDLHWVLYAPVLLGLAVGLSLLLQRRRAALVCITLGAFYVASLPRFGARGGGVRAGASAGRAELPVLVHVILDEQWGIGGLRLEGDTATANFLTRFYLDRGFEVYPAAYSRYEYTMESVPAVVSLGKYAPSALANESVGRQAGFDHRLPFVPYFEVLRARGYAIRVIQSGYMDFCAAPAAPVASCETQSGNTVANIAYVGGSAVSRAVLAGRFFLSARSHVYEKLHPGGEVWKRSSVGGGLVALRHLADGIAAGPRSGVAYFVHALVPHRPIEVDAECRVLDDLERRVGYEQPAWLSDSAWAARLALVGGQIRCAHREIAAVLDAVDRTVGRDRAIVIVHGDHGGRVFQAGAKQWPLWRLNARQLGGRYATLLAVRRPGVPARIAPEPVPVQEFVWRLANQGFGGRVSPDFRHYVLASVFDTGVTDTLRALPADAVPWALPAALGARRP